MTPELLAAAVTACGEGATDADIVDQLIRFSLMLEDDSPVAKRVHRVMTAQRFVADLVAVNKEESSTRAILTVRTEPSKRYPEGLEPIRTDRTDNPDGLRMARQAKSLIGHRVLVFKQMEDAGPDTKVRVVVHLIDLGPARTQ